ESSKAKALQIARLLEKVESLESAVAAAGHKALNSPTNSSVVPTSTNSNSSSTPCSPSRGDLSHALTFPSSSRQLRPCGCSCKCWLQQACECDRNAANSKAELQRLQQQLTHSNALVQQLSDQVTSL